MKYDFSVWPVIYETIDDNGRQVWVKRYEASIYPLGLDEDDGAAIFEVFEDETTAMQWTFARIQELEA